MPASHKEKIGLGLTVYVLLPYGISGEVGFLFGQVSPLASLALIPEHGPNGFPGFVDGNPSESNGRSSKKIYRA